MAICLLLLLNNAAAQFKGHNITGDYGLESGTLPPPGIYITNLVWIYPTSTLKDKNGVDISSGGKITSFMEAPVFSYVSNFKLFGGEIGGMVVIPFLKNRIERNSLDAKSSMAISDIYIQPVKFGWHIKHADFTAWYGVFFPTGKFKPGGSNNSGLGMVSHELSAGSTIFFDKKKTWSFSALMSYELHEKKRHINIKVGDLVTVEGGFGKTFYKKVNNPLPMITNVGAVYYTQFKTTADSGRAIPPNLAGNKDRVFAIGPEFNIFVPQVRMTFAARYLPEFGARLRTQGQTIVISATFLAKSLIRNKMPTP